MPLCWNDTADTLPPEQALVTIRTRGMVRPRYYRIEDRWYSLDDLRRWQMNTSPYWEADRAWYLKTEQVEAWAGDVASQQGKR